MDHSRWIEINPMSKQNDRLNIKVNARNIKGEKENREKTPFTDRSLQQCLMATFPNCLQTDMFVIPKQLFIINIHEKS